MHATQIIVHVVTLRSMLLNIQNTGRLRIIVIENDAEACRAARGQFQISFVGRQCARRGFTELSNCCTVAVNQTALSKVNEPLVALEYMEKFPILFL